jgi:uncharacterized coiled-coil protein SlyX
MEELWRRLVSDNVENVTLEILKGLQASVAALTKQVARLEPLPQLVRELTERFDRLEASTRKDRRDMAGMLVMMRAVAGDFDQRVREVEERLTALEGHAS